MRQFTNSPTSRYISSKKLNIALVIKNFVATGGAERYAVEVARRIMEKGHSIDIYARNIDQNLTKGMTVVNVPDKLKFSSVLSLHSFAKETLKLMADTNYDVIHTHDKGCDGHVSTVHTFSYKKGIEKLSFIKKLNDFGLSPRAWLYLHMEKKQMGSHALAAVSGIIKKDIQTYHQRTDKVSIITPGVDIDGFSPGTIARERLRARESEHLKPDETAVLFVGSEFRRKGLDHLIPAIGENMKLFVVGRKEHMRHYTNLVKQYDLSDRIIFTGLTDNVIKYYALADIVVLPSIAEAFGMTVLEGMACGLPVVTSCSAGCSSLVKTGENGFVFQDHRELSDILTALKDTDVRTRIGANARKTALENTWDKTAQRYETLYYDVAASNAIYSGRS